jgi:hypothetical protein
VAEAHQVPACFVLKVKLAWPLLPVVPVPEAATVPEHVLPEKMLRETAAPLIELPELASSAVTVKGTL